MKKKTVRLHIPDLSEDLHAAIKVAAAEDRKPLKEWVKDILRREIEFRRLSGQKPGYLSNGAG